MGHVSCAAFYVDILPTHFISVHQSAIRAVVWIRVPPTSSNGAPAMRSDPTVIASGGYDGVECLTDIREPYGHVVNRTRGMFVIHRFVNEVPHPMPDVINTASYSVFAAGPIMIDHDNTVKAYSVSPTMLGRGHILMEPDGPVWVRGEENLTSTFANNCVRASMRQTITPNLQ